MRKRLFLLAGLVFIIKSWAQVYHPIPTDSVWWVETQTRLMPQSGGPDCASTTYMYIFPSGVTTLINGNLYHELRYNFYTELQPIWPMSTCNPNYSGSNVLYGFIRNDTAAKLVYIYDSMNTHQEHVVYDFTMSLGDTISPPSYAYQGVGCPNDTFVVSKIDSINIGGEWRKRFGITKSSIIGDTTYIIEGVGNDLGLMYGIFCPFEDGSTLICYHYKNLQYIPVAQTGSPYCITTLAIQSQQDVFFKNAISFIGANTYYVHNEEKERVVIHCYDMLGKVMLEQSFTESGYLDFSEMPAGVYVMYIEYNGQPIKPYKFVVNN